MLENENSLLRCDVAHCWVCFCVLSLDVSLEFLTGLQCGTSIQSKRWVILIFLSLDQAFLLLLKLTRCCWFCQVR